QHGAELAQIGGDDAVVRAHRDQRFIALDVGRDRPRTHVRAVAQHAVADIVEVRHLRVIEEDGVFYLHGISHHTVFADDGLAADKGTVAYLRAMIDDGRAGDGRRGGDGGVPGDPYVLAGALVFL